MKIIIPKGSKIYSTHPVRNKIISTRQQTVEEIHNKKDFLSWCTRIEWAGSAGYWRWVEINDEIIDANPELKKVLDRKEKNDRN